MLMLSHLHFAHFEISKAALQKQNMKIGFEFQLDLMRNQLETNAELEFSLLFLILLYAALLYELISS